jgi:hypothetical protein
MPTTIETTPRIAIYGTGQFGTLAAKIAVQKGWSVVAAVLQLGGVDIAVGPPHTHAIAVMIAQGSGGDVVQLASSKSTVTELAAELAEYGVRVNGVAFGDDPDELAVARAARALVDGSLAKTTGLIIPIGR